MGRFEFLDSVAVADCAIEVEGHDLGDLFATAARAVAEVMVDPVTVAPEVERTVTLHAPSLDLLLFDWLGELIYLKDSEQLVFTTAEVEVEQASPCRLTAHVRGGRLDRPGTAWRADVKAVTFHLFEIRPHGSGWRARVVVDI
jgi:SHS2 domain-containing protein